MADDEHRDQGGTPSAPPAPMRPLLSFVAGDPLPLGATVEAGAVNFSVFAQHATTVDLLLFDHVDDPFPAQTIRLEPGHHRTFNYWHARVFGVREGQLYGYRVFGPWDPARGHRYDPNKVLVDPYARAIVYSDSYSRAAASLPGDNARAAMKGVVVDVARFDWDGVAPPRCQPHRRVLYEMHVRGFTRHPSSRVAHPGTFAAVVQKIPYLLELGVTTVQLLPVFQFDENEVTNRDPVSGKLLTNYWGYSPLGFFAPHRGHYTEDWRGMRYLTSFRDMVRELHRAGLEVILDVVYNHTGEAGVDGPTVSLRGFDNAVYYILDPDDPSQYADYSGCGNTLNANHPMVRRLILDSLRYWVETMHVDGFRFDLASALVRDERGRPMRDPPLLWAIETDPALMRTKLIAEAWDAAGLYQVGSFPGERWSEWNGRFRDDVRRFVRGDHGFVGALAARLLGSADIYEPRGREPHQSINYVTAHDGFTLADLVSFATKHNHENGEANRDGMDENYSSGYGAEGATHDPAILAVRRRQARNLLALTLLAHGTPMLLMGDEVGRTQRGNNNAYCQDNEISWLNWDHRPDQVDLFRFTRLLIAHRKAHAHLQPRRYAIGDDVPSPLSEGRTIVTWHGVRLNSPDWSAAARTLAYTLSGDGGDALHIMVNAHDEALRFALPTPRAGQSWWRALDTGRPSPEDVRAVGDEEPWPELSYLVGDHSVVMLVAR